MTVLFFYNGILQAQWVQTNLTNNNVRCFAANDINIFTGTISNGVFRSNDNGTNWKQINNGFSSYSTYSLVIRDSNIFAGNLNGVYLSTNNGTTWTRIINGMDSSQAVFSLALCGNNIIAGTDIAIYISTNNGTNWVMTGVPGYRDIDCLLVNGLDIYAGTQYGLYFSNDCGISWILIGLPTYTVASLAVCGNNIIAGTVNQYKSEGKIFISTDNGNYWKLSVTTSSVYSLTSIGSYIFAGTDYGVILSTNNGTEWSPIGLTSYTVNSIIILGEDIFAGTNGAGIWRRPLSELVSVSKEVNLSPKDYKLSPNYPNPFNPSTQISYSLPSATNVKLIVYNTSGQIVKVLENGFKNAGNYSINFNASDLPSGIYFYKLEAGQFSQVKKMMLLK